MKTFLLLLAINFSTGLCQLKESVILRNPCSYGGQTNYFDRTLIDRQFLFWQTVSWGSKRVKSSFGLFYPLICPIHIFLLFHCMDLTLQKYPSTLQHVFFFLRCFHFFLYLFQKKILNHFDSWENYNFLILWFFIIGYISCLEHRSFSHISPLFHPIITQEPILNGTNSFIHKYRLTLNTLKAYPKCFERHWNPSRFQFLRTLCQGCP